MSLDQQDVQRDGELMADESTTIASSTHRDSSLHSTHTELKKIMTVSNITVTSVDKADKTDFSTVSNEDFLKAIFGIEASDTRPIICNFIGDPGNVPGYCWTGDSWVADTTDMSGSGRNWYFTGARFSPDGAGNYRRIKKQFASLHAIVLDDIGTKAGGRDRLDGLPPSWLIETSPGNFHAGYIFDEPLQNGVDADALVDALVSAGLCDSGAKGPSTRLGRLPHGSNGKYTPAFSCRLVEWYPARRYTPARIVERLELVLPETKAKRVTPSSRVAGATIGAYEDDVYVPVPGENAVIASLKERGLFKSQLGSLKHDITCPWVHEHTEGVDGGTAYFEPRAGYAYGGFKCQHGHCSERHIGALLEHLSISPQQARHKPLINVKPGEMDRVVDAAEQVLASSKEYYQRGGLICSVITDPGTKETIIKAANASGLARALSASAIWERFDGRTKAMVPTDPPARTVSVLYDSMTYRHLPVLNGIARQAHLRPDGSLAKNSGYDPVTAMFGVFDESAFDIPDTLTREDAMAALMKLKGLLQEFGFASGHDRSASLAAMVTAAIRPSLPLAPMFHVQASQISSGKSYLSALISGFASPTTPSAQSFPKDDEECSKLLLSNLLMSPSVICFDNLTTDLIPHKSLCSALTEESLTGRILGVSRTATVPTRTLFLSSGNNVGPVKDMTRRCVTIHLDAQCECPAEREFKLRPLQMIRNDRAQYVSFALTIIRAWIEAGRPITSCKELASYTEWSDLVRQPLLWLGEPDPAHSVFESMAEDPDRELLGRFMRTWQTIFGSTPTMVRDVVKASQIFGAGEEHIVLHEIVTEIAGGHGAVNRGRLGWWIKRHSGRIVDGLRFEKVSGKRNADQWQVKSMVSGLPVLSGISPVVAKSVKAETETPSLAFGATASLTMERLITT